jgi:hypothetical protein
MELNSTSIENGYLATISSWFLYLAKAESAIAMKHAGSTEFHLEATSRVFIHA